MANKRATMTADEAKGWVILTIGLPILALLIYGLFYFFGSKEPIGKIRDMNPGERESININGAQRKELEGNE